MLQTTIRNSDSRDRCQDFCFEREPRDRSGCFFAKFVVNSSRRSCRHATALQSSRKRRFNIESCCVFSAGPLSFGICHMYSFGSTSLDGPEVGRLSRLVKIQMCARPCSECWNVAASVCASEVQRAAVGAVDAIRCCFFRSFLGARRRISMVLVPFVLL
jgi:hypothetical protein